ncbi:hypothetical protein BLOT_009052 [Blomia tropicalis]|nr:hypothetical protein BLOT_009052 [Blomia tropicalis]
MKFKTLKIYGSIQLSKPKTVSIETRIGYPLKIQLQFFFLSFHVAHEGSKTEWFVETGFILSLFF